MKNRGRGIALTIVLATVSAACAEDNVADDTYVDADPTMAAEEQVGDDWGTWDADPSNYIDEGEFDSWFDDATSDLEWDLDADDGYSRDEYAEGLFGLWDEDTDDRIDQMEWNRGAERVWGEDAYAEVWTDWDADGDSELDLNEVRERMERDGLYDRVDGDADGLIDDEELADWFFDIFDFDNDNQIDSTEWESTWFSDVG